MESSPRTDHRNGGGSAAVERPVPQAQAIADLWSEYLGAEAKENDDFFALGGTSLAGIKIIDRLADDYGVRLSVRAFYLAQTPARVAELIEQGRAGT
ncbi:acyl carrier protein [Micromonospora sp. Llam7]|nr:acyl carrier protein [Micromonospora tarapacensis]MBX7266437.1 acyl carrier protein [Micromonospora tarapacensis]